jgi:O-antigen ligase
MVVAAERYADRGARGRWQVTHNTYTEYSSELGIPGLVLFLTLLVLIWRTTSTGRRLYQGTEKDEPQLMLFSLRIALVASLVNFMFASVGYLPLVPALAGLAYLMSRYVRPLVFEIGEDTSRLMTDTA